MLEVDEAGVRGNCLALNLMEMRFARAPTLAKNAPHTLHFSEISAAYSPLYRKKRRMLATLEQKAPHARHFSEIFQHFMKNNCRFIKIFRHFMKNI